MAIHGIGREYDAMMKASTYLKTTTSQYCVVGAQGNTSAADYTAYLANNGQTLNDTGTAYNAIGVNQTYLTANSEDPAQIRLFGLTKVKCESTVSAGDFVVAYDGISTSSHPGHIVSLNKANEANVTCATYGTSVATFYVVLGRAMQDGNTNSVITIFLNPQLYDRAFWAYS